MEIPGAAGGASGGETDEEGSGGQRIGKGNRAEDGIADICLVVGRAEGNPVLAVVGGGLKEPGGWGTDAVSPCAEIDFLEGERVSGGGGEGELEPVVGISVAISGLGRVVIGVIPTLEVEFVGSGISATPNETTVTGSAHGNKIRGGELWGDRGGGRNERGKRSVVDGGIGEIGVIDGVEIPVDEGFGVTRGEEGTSEDDGEKADVNHLRS